MKWIYFFDTKIFPTENILPSHLPNSNNVSIGNSSLKTLM